MSKVRKLAVTIAALAALAIGGAAFAQAQSATTATVVPTHKSAGEATSPGDTDSIEAGDQSGTDQGGKADPQDNTGEQADAEGDALDAPDGPGDHADGADRETQD
jgi:hypothetical protein